jgi:hypothetical protein
MVACHRNGDEADDRWVNLRWDTQRNNLLDTTAHGTNYWRNRTHCPRRHPLRAPNLCPWEPSGRRACLACNRAGRQVRTAASKGIHLDFQTLADEKYAAVIATDGALRRRKAAK